MGFFTEDEVKNIKRKARKIIPERVGYWAEITYGRIAIRLQSSRWGSCAANGNLNFNCLLVLMPSEVLDSVVVHELCHRRHMNHSKEFYAEIDRVFPDYRRWNKWLKDNGGVYLKRVGK
ncbi:M48 family metallopeptidase [uncultured Treponema sp.]|uniref:M48 family metallopeptidase n=1 Tax=uncultured Treponema sp. TaxID=162155 RepID=UPI002804FA67|nr:M48 family metallopeptidase [uncultured Treponema sp.]